MDKIGVATLNWLGWGLLILALIMLIWSQWAPLDTFTFLNSALPLGILVALAGNILTQARYANESREKRSRFYLDSTVQAYEEARRLLSNGNNDRPTWIAAGRALEHAKELAGKVAVDEHLRVLEVHKLRYRGFFHDLLKDKTASFFYGVANSALPIDKAAELSTASEEKNGIIMSSTLKSLSEKSIHAVWEAAQFPEEYRDPLNREFSAEEKGRLVLRYPRLHEFLDHRERYHSVSGKLFPKGNQKSR